MRGFSSGVADQISAFVRHREAAGAICDSYREYLHLFDAHCAKRFPDERAVTQEMVLESGVFSQLWSRIKLTNPSRLIIANSSRI